MALDQAKGMTKMFEQVRERWGAKYGVDVIDQARAELEAEAAVDGHEVTTDVGEYFGLLSARVEKLNPQIGGEEDAGKVVSLGDRRSSQPVRSVREIQQKQEQFGLRQLG